MDARAFAPVVQNRARQRCEYCQMHQSLQGATFHVEHILPVSRGGLSNFENLAWCCPSCNLHKSDRMHAIDADTNQLAALFHPRRDDWNDHFAWLDYRLTGRTVSGRATIAALKLNTDRRLLIRRAEERFNLFPPK
jgi:HNH endonuclease